jgi:hypothetical protein
LAFFRRKREKKMVKLTTAVGWKKAKRKTKTAEKGPKQKQILRERDLCLCGQILLHE